MGDEKADNDVLVDMRALQARKGTPLAAFALNSHQFILTHMCSFLDARSLLNFHEAVSSGVRSAPGLKGLVQACNTKQLWVTLMQQDFKAGVLEVNMPNARRDPKKKYLAKRQEFVRQEIERKKQHERLRLAQVAQERHRARQKCYGKVSNVLHCFQEPVLTCCVPVCAVLLLVLLVVSLNAGDPIGWGTMAPLLAAVGMVTLGVCCICYVHHVDRPVPFHDDTFDDSKGLIRGIVYELDGNRSEVSLCALVSCVAAFAVTLSFKLTGSVDWDWVYVFFPLYVGFFLLLCFPCMFEEQMGEPIPTCMGLWVVVFAPLLTFIVLLNVRLDGAKDIPLAQILIPLFIWDGCSFCFALYLFGEEDEAAAPIAWCAMVLPPTLFQALLAAYVDMGAMSIVTICIPLYIWAAIWLVGGAALSFKLMDDRW